MNDLLINLHIPKTGGTTLRDIIHRQYPINNIITIPTLSESKDIINNVSLNREKQLDIIQGHLQYGIHKKLNRNIKYFTILRDPIKRILSTYYYIINQPNNPQNLSNAIKTMSIYEYINSGINPFLINGQTQLIAGNACSINDPLIKSNELLEIAKNNINKNFIFTGVTELFDDSILILKKKLDWKTPYYSKANKTKYKPNYNNIDSKIKNFIESHNQLDIKLYNYVKNMIDEDIHSAGKNFQKDVYRFKRINYITNPIFSYSRAIRYFSKKIKFF